MIDQVLVVDDVGYTRALFRHALTRRGYSVTCASTGVEALRSVENEFPGLVVLDINLPDISGIEVLREIRRQHRKIPVVIITARDAQRYYQEAMELAVYAFLSKPVDINDFLELIDEIFDPASHILVVEDEPETLDLYSRFLKEENFRVSTCENGLEAMKLLMYRNYDAAILDLNLPGTDGIEVIRSLRAQGDKIPIIITTAYASENTAEQLKEFSIASLLEKPLDMNELLENIKRLLGSIKSSVEGDFLIFKLAGNVQNAAMFRDIITKGLKMEYRRLIFDLNKVSDLSSSLEEALLTILGKDSLASRIVCADTESSVIERIPSQLISATLEAAKQSIISDEVRIAQLDQDLSRKPVSEEFTKPVSGLKKVKGESYEIFEIPAGGLEVGMILSSPISNESGKVILLGEGIALKEGDIDQIKKMEHITSVFIKKFKDT